MSKSFHCQLGNTSVQENRLECDCEQKECKNVSGKRFPLALVQSTKERCVWIDQGNEEPTYWEVTEKVVCLAYLRNEK